METVPVVTFHQTKWLRDRVNVLGGEIVNRSTNHGRPGEEAGMCILRLNGTAIRRTYTVLFGIVLCTEDCNALEYG